MFFLVAVPFCRLCFRLKPTPPPPCWAALSEEKLDHELRKMWDLVVEGDFMTLQVLVDGWKRGNAYVHNLDHDMSDSNYSQIRCSDLDYLATKKLNLHEAKWNSKEDRRSLETHNLTVSRRFTTDLSF